MVEFSLYANMREHGTLAETPSDVPDARFALPSTINWMRTHEDYDVPRDIFATFFAVVAEVIREILGAEWTPEFAEAWDEVLAEIDSFVQKVPVVPA